MSLEEADTEKNEHEGLWTKPVVVECSRCHTLVNGTEEYYRDILYSTNGYFIVNADSYWHKYARPGETILCYECMRNDPQWRSAEVK